MDTCRGTEEQMDTKMDTVTRIPDEDREHLVSILFACPFCGNKLAEQDPPDTIYPVGRTDLWQAVCQGSAGGCDASPEQFDVAVDAAKAEFGRALRARKT